VLSQRPLGQLYGEHRNIRGNTSNNNSRKETKKGVRANHIAHLRQLKLKISDFSGEMFKDFEVLYFSMSATTTQLHSSGEFCKLRYDTIPVKSASAKRFFLFQ
jgi:hypothetical protein